MLSLTAASARSMAQEAVDALVEGRYHELMSWSSGLFQQQQQQRILSFTEGHEQRLQDRLSDFLRLSCDGSVAGKQDQQRQKGQEEQERHILQWLKEMRSIRSQDHGSSIVLDKCCETSPVFQRSFDSEMDVEVEKQTTTLSRTLVLVLVEQVGASAMLLDRSVGVVLVVEDEKEAPWKFHGIVCVAGSEERLVSQGWRRMHGDTGQSVPSMATTAAPVASTTCSIQEQQYLTSAGRYCDEEDDDSDDDYWGQYGDPDSDHDDSASGESSNDSSPKEDVSSPSSSLADTAFTLASTYHSPATTGAVRSSTAISMAVNTIFTTTSAAYTTNFISGPNNCRWEEVNEIDEEDDDEYWGKYGDHDEPEPEPEPKQQQHRGEGQDSEVPPKDSSHANHDNNTNDIYGMKAERQKIDPTVPTTQKEALHISSEAALPDSAFPTLVAHVSVVPEPGQVDPTALTLRLMNLIVHHTDPTGYSGAARVHRDQQFYSYDEDDDIDDQLADNKGSTYDNTSNRSRTRGGFLIRLDSRLQQDHDSAAVTPLESEYQSHTNHATDKDGQREGENGVDTEAPSALFSAPALAFAFHSHSSNTNNTNNIKDNGAGSGTSPPSSSSSQSRFKSQSLSHTISISGSLPLAPASLPNPSISSFPPPPQHSPHFTDRRQQQQEQEQQDQQEQNQQQEQQQDQQESLSPYSCTDSAFHEYLDQPCDNNSRTDNNHTNNNNNDKSINNACTSISEREKQCEDEREQFLSSLRSIAQEAKAILGLTKADFLDMLDRAYDSPVAFTTTTTH